MRRLALVASLAACQATPPDRPPSEPRPDAPVAAEAPASPASRPPIAVAVARGRVTAARQRARIPHASWLGALAWSPDAARLATGDDDAHARVLDARTGAALRELPDHERRVSALAWSPDGARLAVAALTDLRVWDPDTGTLLHRLRGHGDIIVDLRVVGDVLHAVDLRGALKRWDLRTGAALASLEVPTLHKLSLAIAPSADLLAMGGYGDLELLDLATNKLRFKLDSPRCDGEAPDLMCAAWTRTRVEEFGHEGSPPSSHEEERPRWYVQSLAFSADASRLLIGRADGVAVLVDAVAGRPIARITSAADDGVAVALSPDGAAAALASRDGHVLLYDVASKATLAVTHEPGQVFAAVAFAPDAAALAAGGPGQAVTIWDLAR